MFKFNIFKKKIKDNKKEEPAAKSEIAAIEIIERPRICCIDIEEKVISHLRSFGYKIETGTLGTKIILPTTSRSREFQLLPNPSFPVNLHEFEIIIIDLKKEDTIEFNEADHSRKHHSGNKAIYLVSSYPETVFDPRPLGSFLLRNFLAQMGHKNYLLVVFTTGDYEMEYLINTITADEENQTKERYSIYAFSNEIIKNHVKTGREVRILNSASGLKAMLEKYLNKIAYNQTFGRLQHWDGEKYNFDEDVIPLIENSNGDIVSVMVRDPNHTSFYFPQISDKAIFLEEFLNKVAIEISPDLFPFSTQFIWKNESLYWLPNQAKLLKEKERIESEFQKQLRSQVEYPLKLTPSIRSKLTPLFPGQIDPLFPLQIDPHILSC